MGTLWVLLCATYLIVVCQCKIHHTVWLPAGKQISLPCKLRALKKHKSPELWVEQNEELEVNFSANSIAAWYDRLGRLIHVGEVLLVHVAKFEASEISVTQYVLRETPPTAKQMSLIPEFRGWIGGANQLLQVNHIDSVTCIELQTSTVVGFRKPWQALQRKSRVGREIVFTFKIYVQPIIVWQYAVPSWILMENASVMPRLVEEWCQDQRPYGRQFHQTCEGIYQGFKTFPQQTRFGASNSSSTMPFLEIGVGINLSARLLHVLADPTTKELGYLHARLQHSLNMYILEGLEDYIQDEDLAQKLVLAARTQYLCPPGSFTLRRKPEVINLTFDKLMNRTLETSSASVLIDDKLLCYPCPDGKATTAYTFNEECSTCPRGYYRGETGWPSSAGCLRCPEGFTTDGVGEESIADCQLNAGALTRSILHYVLHLLFTLEKIIAGETGPDTQTRSLALEQRSAWAWLGRIRKKFWIYCAIYCLLSSYLAAKAIHRLHVYLRLKALIKKQCGLLLKATMIGQINLVSHIKQRMKQAIKEDPTDTLGHGAPVEVSGVGESIQRGQMKKSRSFPFKR
ncbi:hypothetical protein CRM22_006667 [Opisthorchis felineus]|uniref:Tyrosine-protein kinase ephrin type A/B receptor-like domain-containing protein n=1 Tax=Opisthorchis felineus TaxID=147828 RepID=A0A4S2LSQ5_OPIFE|nr:hypothetical protein CRM22_006667 [Opisthorchis felineus]